MRDSEAECISRSMIDFLDGEGGYFLPDEGEVALLGKAKGNRKSNRVCIIA